MSEFYVYAYLRSKDSLTGKSGTPYYIGKGTGNRAYVKHYAPLPKDTSNITFIKQNLTEQQAHDLEIELIAKYGRKDLGTGILHNRTNGGEGISNPSIATREKLAYAKRNESVETRLKRSIAAKNRVRTPLSEETKKRISEANTGKKRSVAAKEKMSQRKKGKSWEEIFGVEEATARREFLSSEEFRIKASVAAKNRSPEGANAIAEANRIAGKKRKEANKKLRGKINDPSRELLKQ